jgi:hypothetical protein
VRVDACVLPRASRWPSLSDAATAETYAKIRPPGMGRAHGQHRAFVALRRRNPLLRVGPGRTSYVVLRQDLAEVVPFMRPNMAWASGTFYFHPVVHGAFRGVARRSLRSGVPPHDEGGGRGLPDRLDRSAEIVPAEFVSDGRIVDVSGSPAPASAAPEADDLAPEGARRSCTLHSKAKTVNHVGDAYLSDTAFRVRLSVWQRLPGRHRGRVAVYGVGVLREAHRKGALTAHPLRRRCLLVHARRLRPSRR